MITTHILGILLCVAGSYALYDSSSDVVTLDPSNFDTLVLKSNEIWIVEFFAPWCGHCKNLVPEYKKAATALKGIAKVGAVDADAHKSLGQTYGVSGFPTIKLFNGKKHTPFQGQRTAEKFIDAALQLAKEKAYEALGKKPKSSSDKQTKNIYGHHIPWRYTRRNSSPTTVKTTNKKSVTTKQSNADIAKFNELQLQLFRSKLINLGRPKVVKAFLNKMNTTLINQLKANEIKSILRTKKSTPLVKKQI